MQSFLHAYCHWFPFESHQRYCAMTAQRRSALPIWHPVLGPVERHSVLCHHHSTWILSMPYAIQYPIKYPIHHPMLFTAQSIHHHDYTHIFLFNAFIPPAHPLLFFECISISLTHPLFHHDSFSRIYCTLLMTLLSPHSRTGSG